MFKERIQFFREGVYLLTGFKVDMTTDREHPQLRLRSMYSEREEDALLFQWGPDGLELMETDFANRLDKKIFTYLSTCNSIPAFLSNLTLELFETRTFVGG
jgi:mitotic spindle assembly checkpoint protein MAD1